MLLIIKEPESTVMKRLRRGKKRKMKREERLSLRA